MEIEKKLEMLTQIALFSFTETGSCMNIQVSAALEKQGYACEGYTVKNYAADYGLHELPLDAKRWIGERWGDYAFLFIGATGIAIRYIAPWVKDKYTDSAVLAMDELGRYVIPLLSGHIGGAVELAEVIADASGGVPVITTATDIQERFAVDVFAKKNRLCIRNRNAAKEVSAAILRGEEVGFYSPYPVHGELPVGIQTCTSYEELLDFGTGFAILDENQDQKDTSKILHLIPKNIVIGLGCRRGVGKKELEEQLQILLEPLGLSELQIAAFTSIDLKADETGILELSKTHNIPFYTYTSEELKEVKSVSPPSAFVESITGVDNVCERAARRHCPEGMLIQAKTKMERVTFAVIQKEMNIYFS